MKFEVVRNSGRDSEGEKILDTIFRLRHGVYTSVGLIKPENYPSGRFEDAWDRIAAEPHGTLHYIAEENGILRAATRIVPYTIKHGWSLGKDVDLEAYLRGNGKSVDDVMPICDGSRIISDKHINPGRRFYRGADDLAYLSNAHAFRLGNNLSFTAANPDFAGFLKINYLAIGPVGIHEHDGYDSDVEHRVQPMVLTPDRIRCTPEQLEPLPAERSYGVFEAIEGGKLCYYDILVEKLAKPALLLVATKAP
ncbi:MAG: hypothetical protein AABX51_06475 [Nanoarchaeota archaeon]|mgnify:CR=1 FL=1